MTKNDFDKWLEDLAALALKESKNYSGDFMAGYLSAVLERIVVDSDLELTPINGGKNGSN